MINEIIVKNIVENYLNKNCKGEYYIVSIKLRKEQMNYELYELNVFERNFYGQPNNYLLYVDFNGIITDVSRDLLN